MDRSNIRSFVTFLGQTLLRVRRPFSPISPSPQVRGTVAQRRLTGFVLLVFGITQIVYPMNLLAAGRTLPGSTPPDSFLTHQVNTVPALVNEIEHNLQIRRNYARHFGLPIKQIAGYLNKNLSLQTLRQPYRHVVYCVRPDGVFFTVRETMPAGTKVFALKNSGRPVLKWKCGNPFTARLPHPDSIVTFLRRTPPPAGKPITQTAAKVEVVTPAETSAVIPTEAVLPSTEVVSSLPLTPAAFIVPAGIVGGGGTTLLPFLPLIPVLFAIGGGGGGGGNSTTGGGTTSTTGTTATTGTTGTTSTATTGTTTTATTGTTGTTSTATTGTTGTTTTATTGTTGTTTTATTGTTGTTATTGTSGTTGTTGTVVPEPTGSSTIGYAFLALALLAFVSSVRRKRASQE